MAQTSETNNYNLASYLQKLTHDEVPENVLKWLAEFSPRNSSDASLILHALETYLSRYIDLDRLTVDSCILLLEVLKKQLLVEEVDIFSLLISNSSKIIKWCENNLSSIKDQELIISHTMKKVLPNLFMLSTEIFKNVEKCSYFSNKELMSSFQPYICQSLDSLKLFCMCQTAQMHEEFHRMAHDFLNVALKVLITIRTSFLTSCGDKHFDELEPSIVEEANIIHYGVGVLLELGNFAAENGKDWVGLLNITWKGIITLLQTTSGKDVWSKFVDIPHITRAVTNCTLTSLRSAAKAWESLLDERVEPSKANDFKRLCIPIKFFLINTIRIVAQYPSQAMTAFRNLSLCALNILSLRHELSKHVALRSGAEALMENVEPSVVLLIHTVFKSSDLSHSEKVRLLEHLGGMEIDRPYSDSLASEKGVVFCGKEVTLQISRLIILLGLMQSCKEFGENICCELAKRLDLCMQLISDSRVYVEMLHLHDDMDKSSVKSKWQCLYTRTLESLQVFFVYIAGMDVWMEVEEFLFRNALHPHPVCRELIVELWCFVARHSEVDMIENQIQNLLFILSDLVKHGSTSTSGWPIQTIGNLVCALVKTSPDILVTKVYELALGNDPFGSPSTTSVAAVLIREHFLIRFLPDNVKKAFILSLKRALSDIQTEILSNTRERCYDQVKKMAFAEEVLMCTSEIFIDESFEQIVYQELYGMLKNVFHFQNHKKLINDDFFLRIWIQSQKIICRHWKKMQPEEIRSAIVSLEDIVKHKLSEDYIRQIKPILAEALAGLGEAPLLEDENDPMCCALWYLYHVILRDRHWAIAHLALASFGYFAAHTSWNELWRFVPSDAALAFDVRTGSFPSEDLFMNSLREFLEKNVAGLGFTKTKRCFEILQQEAEWHEKKLDLVQTESKKLKCPEHLCDIQVNVDTDVQMDSVGDELSSEIRLAMKMLEDGLTLLKDKMPTWLGVSGYDIEHQNQINEQVSLLADVIVQLVQYNSSRQEGS